MSFSDEPSLSLGQKLGCFAYLILSSAVVLFLAMMAVLGDWKLAKQRHELGSDESGAACHYDLHVLSPRQRGCLQ